VSSFDGRTHYEVLGVARSASLDEIRSAYRLRARLAHPDRPGGAAEAMARLNEAYRVLNDPGRRAMYDRRLDPGAAPSTGSSSTGRTVGGRRPAFEDAPPAPVAARFPWRFVLGLAVLGSTGVVLSAALAGPEDPALPDGVLRSGSCVEIDQLGFAREVSCSGDGADRVVRVLVPTDSVCPAGTAGHLDRLGLGRACVEP
jgi:molecular chaperone DnaJ